MAMNWNRQQQLTTTLFIGAILLLLTLAAGSIISGLRQVNDNDRLTSLRGTYELSHGILQGLVDAETGVRGFVITNDPAYLEPYYSGIAHVGRLTRIAREGDPILKDRRNAEGKTLFELAEQRETIMANLIAVMNKDGRTAAQNALAGGAGKRAMDQVRDFIATVDEEVGRETTALSSAAETNTRFLSIFFAGSMVLSVLLSSAQFWLFRGEISRRGVVEADLNIRHRQMALISQLSDSLHSSNSRDESYQVIETFARDILAGTSGTLYVYNNSRDQLHRAAAWGEGKRDIADHFGPDECWALRRGKMHVSAAAGGHINCHHITVNPGHAFVCLPITARGQTSGLLCMEASGTASNTLTDDVAASARNFADQLSLALVNIELRERLQNMAIRDPLTELYNRRFMDEALARELALAQRKGGKLCIAMLDIDHFKKVNDTYGHPAGDEILKLVARYLVSALRRSDFICRYGGEEMMLVLPDCDHAEGLEKAQMVCDGIRDLKIVIDGDELPSVTVSIGVAIFPDDGATRTDIVGNADQALYQAKRGGRNRVVMANADSSDAPAEAKAHLPAAD